MSQTAAGQHCAASGRLLLRVPGSDIQIWLLRLIDLDDAARSLLLAPFPELLPQAAPARRLAHALLRHWLGELLDCPATQIALATRAQGKPWLPDHNIAISYSHSRRWLALAWSRQAPEIGVDIEDCGREQAFPALARRYFHPHEQALWLEAPESGRERQWLRTWTRKEAMLKAHGLGLRLRLNTLDTCDSPVQHAELGRWRLYTSDLDDAVVSMGWPA